MGKKNLHWVITLDLKGFFHRLQMIVAMQRWMIFQFTDQSYQIQARSFAWALGPWWANKFTKLIKAWKNTRLWELCWWVDNILVLAQTKEEEEKRATMLIHKLLQLGVQVNDKKSMTQASQQVVFVGH